MENATITELENGMFQIVPDEGFMLRNKLTNTLFAEAVTFDVTEFEAVEV